eukprot:CAMPEP_0205917996 /NCGR_PEP_ID=MMETSP1325-20131115/9520_1 /ASSEMBLY_ACC=CAM_ASM_000708 /TAXON_ID=236786 /ORGANISM="Florenciella sp., Strain RCC1007" /LENGTH=58 /DNA_ID=CAMNT_0053285479 /DNA_START=957 /DNA_END=1133 /DNA_ORIENTATION=-
MGNTTPRMTTRVRASGALKKRGIITRTSKWTPTPIEKIAARHGPVVCRQLREEGETIL